MPRKQDPQKWKKQKQNLNNYVKYSGLAFQMIAIIVIGTFGGLKLDSWLELSFPVFTLILSFASVVLAIYYAVKDFI